MQSWYTLATAYSLKLHLMYLWLCTLPTWARSSRHEPKDSAHLLHWKVHRFASDIFGGSSGFFSPKTCTYSNLEFEVLSLVDAGGCEIYVFPYAVVMTAYCPGCSSWDLSIISFAEFVKLGLLVLQILVQPVRCTKNEWLQVLSIVFIEDFLHIDVTTAGNWSGGGSWRHAYWITTWGSSL